MVVEQTNTTSDNDLLAQIKAGQSDLFAVLYDRHAPAVYRHILFRCEDTAIAEDVVSQTFLHIWDHIREGKSIQSFRSFLFQSARNIFVDMTRKREFKNVSLEEILENDDRKPVGKGNLLEDIMIGEEVHTLKQALASLPEHYKEIITLRYLSELSISEIAKVTGKNSGTIYVSLHRGTRLLRQALVDAQPPTPLKTFI